MLKNNVEQIKNYLSGERAYNTIKDLMVYHRIQASTGYREAADYCCNLIKENGIDTEILSFPANEHTSYWTSTMFKEWDCKGGYLDLTYPKNERLCDFMTNSNSIIARSGPADYRDQDIDIVLMDRGINPENYKDLDLKGKLIFVDTDHKKFRWALNEKGAIGVVAERMWDMNGFRTKGEMQNARQSMAFSWHNEKEDIYQFGFVLNSMQADELRAACKNMEIKHQEDNSKKRYPTAKCFVNSKIYDGAIEDVVSVIPGQTDEEIVLVAHLCHPKTSANDNSSGVAGAIEAMKTISDLIKSGKLQKPKRSIKLILMPEFTGTYSYLATREDKIKNMKAGMNMDMIGSSQNYNGCCTTITDLPHAAPSFVHDVACLIIDEIKKDASMVNDGDISLYNYQPTDYMPQSDHFIYSDPSIGVPMLMMGQWPDKFYHTSADTIEKIDPEMLKRNSVIAASYAYTLANLLADDVDVIFGKLNERLMLKVIKRINMATENGTKKNELIEEKEYFKNVYLKKANDVLRFFANEMTDDIKLKIEKENKFIENIIDKTYDDYIKLYKVEDDNIKKETEEKYKLIPKKLFMGPVSPYNFFSQTRGSKREKLYMLMDKYDDVFEACDFMTYWSDGINTIEQIVKYMSIEAEVENAEFVYDYLSFLKELGIMELN